MASHDAFLSFSQSYRNGLVLDALTWRVRRTRTYLPHSNRGVSAGTIVEKQASLSHSTNCVRVSNRTVFNTRRVRMYEQYRIDRRGRLNRDIYSDEG